jgi:peptidoglycan/xylan/chitin deacetylase (PgdA/CDA1 family)
MYELKRELLHLSANEYESVVRSLEEQFCTSLAADGAGDLYTAPLTWADVRSMHQLGMTVGGHTVTHCNLTLLGPEALRQELRHSRERIEAEVGVPCRHLCYPQGLYDERVIEAAKECGYRTGVTASQGFNRCRDNLYALRRWGMQAEPYKVIRMITGMDDAVQRVTRFFKRAG